MSLMSWMRNLFTARSEAPQKVELGRNDLCWCGSGKKYKRCHLPADEAKEREANYAAQFAAQQRRRAGLVPPGTKSQKRRPDLPEAKGPGPSPK